jgi:hypothetical protein
VLAKELAALFRPNLSAFGKSVFLLVANRATSLEFGGYRIAFADDRRGRLRLIIIASQMDRAGRSEHDGTECCAERQRLERLEIAHW